MVSAKGPERANKLPAGFIPIPIHPAEQAPLKICVVARQTPDPVAGHLIVLRDLHDAMVYMGCVVDAGGDVVDWLELWVQNVDGLETSLPALRESFSNQALDERWKLQATTFKALSPFTCLQTGWEESHPFPTFLDVSKAAPIFTGKEGKRWELCQDDQRLAKAGLPPYSTSLFRYLHDPVSES